MNLSDTEVMNITHFARGNGLILTNNNNVTVEFKASALETEMITTDPVSYTHLQIYLYIENCMTNRVSLLAL